MTSEENEQLVKDIVGEVLSASLDEHQNNDAENDGLAVEGGPVAVSDQHQKSIQELSGEEVNGGMTDAMKDLTLGDGGVKEQDEHSLADKNDTIQEPHKVSGDSDGKDGKENGQELAGAEVEHFADHSKKNGHDHSSEESKNLGTNEVISPSNLEPKLETTDDERDAISGTEEGKALGDRLEIGGDGKEFEPTTPPALGMNVQQKEDHQLVQHQQQSTLFASSGAAAARGSVAEESDFASTEHADQEEAAHPKTKNGGEGFGGKNQQSGTDGGKTNEKAKSKLCSIL